MEVRRLLGRLENVTKAGNGWKACCPAHDDHDPSLSVSIGDNGRLLVHCHAGCETSDVMGSIGLTMRDLSPPATTAAPKSMHRSPPAIAVALMPARIGSKRTMLRVVKRNQ